MGGGGRGRRERERERERGREGERAAARRKEDFCERSRLALERFACALSDE